MDDVLYALFFTPPILAGANVLLAVFAQQRLLRELRGITTERHMLKFKQFAATQMYQALFQLAAGVVAMMTAGYAWLGAQWPGEAVLLCLSPTIGVSVFGILVKPLEARVKKLPVADELREDFNHVVDTWMRKALPDW